MSTARSLVVSLRKELAQRMYEDAWPFSTIVGWEASPNQSFYLKIADECIRQMEWARRETTFVTFVDYDEAEVDFKNLTLAPPEWAPPASEEGTP